MVCALAFGQGQATAGAGQSPDDARLAAAGIRKVAGRHLTLYTDLPAEAEIDRLPAVFDQAVPQWTAYFGVDPASSSAASTSSQRSGQNAQPRIENWQIRGYLIKDRAKFDALGLMPPAGADRFLNGYSVGDRFWWYEQPTAYYRRHLMLHEGTHAFMSTFLGGMGPVWYMEGTAELFATHRLDANGTLTLRVMPRERDEVPMLGRIALLEDAREKQRLLGLAAVMQLDRRGLVENETYAWCWAMCVFLDSHPRYRERFHDLRQYVASGDFNDRMHKLYQSDWPELLAEWKAFVASVDHGFDFVRMAIDFQPGEALLPGASRSAVVQADRGWQTTRVRVEAGRTYRVSASGQFQVAEEIDNGQATPWISEAGGVTIEYYAGRPLGMLIGAIDAEDPAASDAGFAQPFAIGLGETILSKVAGTLYLRVNDSPGKLDDNRGSLNVRIESAVAMGEIRSR